ncbi:hypothetical protein EYF80_059424 [Liparis tanakae]|uniref:Uncharacterized protein n=1 Tax=Liparis tanakae TaxID=230148 RepID=A0A4Z2EPV1_9TELE|nr:hypothetical protein EYF80_059424 [Liparis tanakae]
MSKLVMNVEHLRDRERGRNVLLGRHMRSRQRADRRRPSAPPVSAAASLACDATPADYQRPCVTAYLENIVFISLEHRQNIVFISKEHRQNIVFISKEHRQNIFFISKEHHQNIVFISKEHRQNIFFISKEHPRGYLAEQVRRVAKPEEDRCSGKGCGDRLYSKNRERGEGKKENRKGRLIHRGGASVEEAATSKADVSFREGRGCQIWVRPGKRRAGEAKRAAGKSCILRFLFPLRWPGASGCESAPGVGGWGAALPTTPMTNLNMAYTLRRVALSGDEARVQRRSVELKWFRALVDLSSRAS